MLTCGQANRKEKQIHNMSGIAPQCYGVGSDPLCPLRLYPSAPGRLGTGSGHPSCNPPQRLVAGRAGVCHTCSHATRNFNVFDQELGDVANEVVGLGQSRKDHNHRICASERVSQGTRMPFDIMSRSADLGDAPLGHHPDEGARSALVVSAAESKDAALTLPVPYIVALGRKGGSPIAVAILHALLMLSAGPAP